MVMQVPFSERIEQLGVELFWDDIGELSPEELERIRAMMSRRERARSDRLRHEPSRRCHLVTRRLVRTTLSRFGSCSPEDWRFQTTQKGRPSIANTASGVGRLDFNIAHSDRRVVLAVVDDGRRVGVDIEPSNRDVDHELVAQRFFHESEQRAIEELHEACRRQRFLQLWVLKEAWLKADGRGVAAGLDRVIFEFDETGRPNLVASPGEEVDDWSFVLGAVDEHVAAVALLDHQ